MSKPTEATTSPINFEVELTHQEHASNDLDGIETSEVMNQMEDIQQWCDPTCSYLEPTEQSSNELVNLPTPSAEFEGDHLSHIAQHHSASCSTRSIQVLQSLDEPYSSDGFQCHSVSDNQDLCEGEDHTLRRERLKIALMLKKKTNKAVEEVAIVGEPVRPQENKIRDLLQFKNLTADHRWFASMGPHVQNSSSRKPHLASELLSQVSDRWEEYVVRRQFSKTLTYVPFVCMGSKKKVWTHWLFQLHLRKVFYHEIIHKSERRFISCMMFVVGFDREVFQLHELSNLFSVSGEVAYTLYYREAKSAVIIMKDQVDVSTCIKQLHMCTIKQQKLSVRNYKHFEGLDPCYLYCQPEVFVPRSSYRRFKQDMPELTQGLTHCLLVHVTGCDDLRIDDQSLLKLLYTNETKPKEVRRATDLNKTNMWFVKYNRKEQAMLAVMKLQGSSCEQGIVRISFTKSKVFMKNSPMNAEDTPTKSVYMKPTHQVNDNSLNSPELESKECSEEKGQEEENLSNSEI